MDITVAKQVIAKYDEILSLVGAKEGELISTAMSKLEPVLDQALSDSTITPEHRDGFRMQILNSVIATVAQVFVQGIRGAASSLNNLSSDDLKKAADEYFKNKEN
jgi:hypothetical protein